MKWEITRKSELTHNKIEVHFVKTMTDKTPRPNGSGTDPLQRLASLKPVRDLSLGAAKPNKKVFLPNLNVARNKNKGPSTSNNQSSKRDDKNKRDRRNDRNKTFHGPNVIKSSGVFSEGVGRVERQSSRVAFGREADPKPVLQKPTIRVRDFVKIDKELEEQKIRSALGENTGPGLVDGPSVDFKQARERDAPIKLPMGDVDKYWSDTPPVKVKEEPVVKEEPPDSPGYISADKPVGVKREPSAETEVVNLINSKEPTLILLQLPDSLPGRGGSADDEAPRRRIKEEPDTATSGSQGTQETDDKPKDSRCHLSCLEAGRIGTLRTHRSGRVTLLLGDTVFEVNTGTRAAFQQEVMSVACDAASRSGALVSLGALHHKLTVAPLWEHMLTDVHI